MLWAMAPCKRIISLLLGMFSRGMKQAALGVPSSGLLEAVKGLRWALRGRYSQATGLIKCEGRRRRERQIPRATRRPTSGLPPPFATSALRYIEGLNFNRSPEKNTELQ